MRKLCLLSLAASLAVVMAIGTVHLIRRQKAPSLPAPEAAARPAKLPGGVDEQTIADIRNSLEKQEYHISFDAKKKKLQSPNRKNNIRAYYEPGKLTVQTRVDTTGEGFRMELVNEGVFADGKLLYAPEIGAKADHEENKVQISHSAFTEEFINDENGVRQNFIIKSAPEGTRHLQVKMAAKGLKVAQGAANELRFYSETRDGETHNELVYSDLKCWDANKHPLNATLAYVDNRIQVTVDVADAAYPVTIDPIIANGTPQNANKVIQVDQSYMWLGFSVASAGDVNGDGYSDVIVGAPHYDKGQDNEGAAFVYKGHGSGLTLSAVTLECNQAGAEMGRAVSTAGDFNGDGYSDVLVGIPYYDLNGKDAGLVKLYFGSLQGINANPALPPLDFLSNNAEDNYGISVATAGDVDGDGYSEILIGVLKGDFGQTNEGLTMLYYGASSNYKKVDQLEANQAGAFFGYSVASAGDIDADGYSDIIVGARYYTNGQGQNAEGAAFIYRGSAGGLLPNPTIIEGNQYDAAMGNQVSSAGDVNGDGYSDILISAYLYDNPGNKDNGIVNLYLGSSSGISPQQQPARTFVGNDNDNLGSAIACAGDVNGDGFSDILIGARYYDNGQFNEGAVYVFQGSKNGVVGGPVATMESNQADGWFGTAVASAGDVNGDGYSDTVVGCYTFDNGQTDEGHVFIYHGGPSGLTAGVSTTLAFQQSGTQFGASVASAGDVNADGYGDVIVGAPYYDGGQSNEGLVFVFYGSPTGLSINNKTLLEHNQADSHFGNAVAGAGDINGDGYDDIIAAAMDYDNGQSDEGVVFVHYGSSGGIDLNSVMLLEHNVINEEFGFSVSGAGDINRDGYADIIVGVIKYSDGQANEGAAFMYYGSNTGLGKLSVFQANQAEARFGSSVSSAGDVNGDGFGDVVVGAPYYDFGQNDEGLVYTLLGTSSGLIWLGSKQLEINKTNAHLGTSVSSAGDVNGDGFDDIIIGASEYVNGQSSEGIAIIYYGSNTGISDLGATKIESNSAYAYLGSSVSGAGDVDGDGYSDVIVGANLMTGNLLEEGKVFVFKGSHAGIIQTPAFSLEGGQQGANLGTSVSSAGDVNGDGYSDIIVGIPHFNALNGPDAGGVKVFYGNSTKDGIQNNTRLYNTNGAILDHSQFSQSGFKAGLFAKSFIGTNQGKLVWETQGQGIPFIKAGTAPNQTITVSTEYIGISFAYSALAGTGAELKNNISKSGLTTKVRVRVKYSPALAITGQVYGPWRYLQPQLTGSFYAPVPEEQVETQTKKLENSEVLTQVRIFPNPVSDKLGIETADAGNVRAVKLVNAYGAAVYQSSKAEREIDVSRLAEGVYILTLQKADGTHSTHRVLIKK